MKQTVAHFGEFSLIERIKFLLPQSDHPEVLVNIGDDTAVIEKIQPYSDMTAVQLALPGSRLI